VNAAPSPAASARRTTSIVNQRFAVDTTFVPSQARAVPRRRHRMPGRHLAEAIDTGLPYDAWVDASDADRSLSAAVDAVRRGDGVVSVVARVAGEDEPRVSVDPDARHYSASIMKLPILVAARR